MSSTLAATATTTSPSEKAPIGTSLKPEGKEKGEIVDGDAGSCEVKKSDTVVPTVAIKEEREEAMSGEGAHSAYGMAGSDEPSLVQRSATLLSAAADIPPFNPLQSSAHDGSTNENAINSSIGNSVVRDLMRVYENLTQSSTPHQASSTHTQEHGTEGEAQSPYQQAQLRQTGSIPPGGYGIPPPVYQIPSNQDRPSVYPTSEQGHSKAAYIPYETAYAGQFAPTPTEYPPASGDQQVSPAAPSSVKSEEADDDIEGAGEESDEQAASTGGRTSSRRKRRGSHDTSSSVAGSAGRAGNNSTKSKKKSKTQDGRWSKRFTWPEDLHRDFVSAIFDVGLKHSSPSTILEHMPKHEQITTERIKSHLQKYRLHRLKSKKEFISSYDASLRNFQNRSDVGNDGQPVSGAGVAAHLSYTAIEAENATKDNKGEENVMEQVAQPHPAPVSADPASNEETGKGLEETLSNSQLQPQPKNDSLMLPQLTEAEKQSPIGAAMGYLMGLFFSLKQQLMIQRSLEAAGVKGQSDAPVEDVFNSFVTGTAPAAAAVGGESATDGKLHLQGPTTTASMRTNIEENSMMKREMLNQMALQNKMRALKQQELAKYKNVASSASNPSTAVIHKGTVDGGIGLTSPQPNREEEFAVQGAGETAGNDGSAEYQRGGGGNMRPHSLSFGGSEEFWHTDVVDEQLFEFLMNN